MAIKLAFSTVACPKWDFDTIAAKAKEYGYHGVEIRGFLNESILTASNVFLTDPAKLKSLFNYHGIEIACLASSIAMTGNKRRDKRLAEDCKRFIDTAAQLDCKLVKIFDTEVHPGQSRASAGIAFGNWLLPLGDYAAQRDISIVVENTLSFRSAKELWLILDRISHPSVGVCWDLFNAVQIGEPPSVSVPVLNSKIQYVQVQDATIGALGATYCKLGEGEVPVEKFIRRLLGIGYDGWITFEWEKAWLPNIAEPEEVLPDAAKKLENWINPPEEEDPKAKKKAAAAKA
jgi:sugar phosphate isomerase/epimerase